MSVIRPSRPEDEEALRRLWKTVFGDEEPFIDAFFRELYTPGSATVAQIGEEIATSVYVIPFGELRYLYALGTDPRFRGKGLGKAVLRAAAGDRPAYFCPASASLRDWYIRAMGAVPVSSQGLPEPPETLIPVSPEEYARARERLLSSTPHAPYSPGILKVFSVYGGFYTDGNDGWYAVEDGRVREAIPPCPGEDEWILALNGAPPIYWGLTLI